MHPDYAMLREDDRTLAFIAEYAEGFEAYMKRTARRWSGDPLSGLDYEVPTTYEYWKDCDSMRKACDATDTHYADFWAAAFEVVFGWDHPHPIPPIFYRKKGEDAPNVAFLIQIIKSIEKPVVVTSKLPYYRPENFVGSPQQREYFSGLKKKLLEMGREDAWQRMVEKGLVVDAVEL